MISMMLLAFAAQDVVIPIASESVATARIATPSSIATQPDTAIPVEVHVTAGDKLIYSDTLLVARNAGAGYSQSRSEASIAPCPENLSHNRSQQTSLNIQLYWNDMGAAGSGTNISVQWQRPQTDGDCLSNGTRGVQINQMVRLAPGESATIRGDAGLTVRVTRR